MLKHLIALSLCIPLALTSTQSHAEWVAGLAYSHLADDDDEFDVGVGILSGSVGYRVEQTDRFSWLPELKIGIGVESDRFNLFATPVDVEVERYIALSLRGSYGLTDQWSLYAQPSYSNLKLKVSAFGSSETDDEWDFGLGIGTGYQFTDLIGAELSYEKFDDADIWSLGVKFSF